MELLNTFTIPSDIATAWATLQDVESIAPCVPGATLESSDGENFTGSVKVKLGPVSMVYGGQARFVSRDEATHTAVIEGSGKETRGTGTAKGLVTAVLVEEAPDRTRVDIVSELQITGKAAQFGKGVMQEVAGRIIDQFAGNLAATMTASSVAAAASSASGESGVPAAAPAPLPKVADSIDLLGTAGAPVLKRLVPAVVVIIVVVALIIWAVKR